MLAGFQSVTRGEILLDGRAVTDLAPQRRNIGMVFQSYALFPHMTIAENIAFPLQARRIGRAEIDDRVRRALAMVKLESFASRSARPAVRRPAAARCGSPAPWSLELTLVLMDEPLGALDKQLREEMAVQIMHLQQKSGIDRWSM